MSDLTVVKSDYTNRRKPTLEYFNKYGINIGNKNAFNIYESKNFGIVYCNQGWDFYYVAVNKPHILLVEITKVEIPEKSRLHIIKAIIPYVNLYFKRSFFDRILTKFYRFE